MNFELNLKEGNYLWRRIRNTLPGNFSILFDESPRILKGEAEAATFDVQGETLLVSTFENEAGRELVAALVKMYPEHDPDQLLWLLICPWHGSWTYRGKASRSILEALANLENDDLIPGRQARLISFYRKDWQQNSVMPITMQAIKPDQSLGEGMTPVLITFTPFEAG